MAGPALVRAYLDASVIMPVILKDDHSSRVFGWLETEPNIAFSLWSIAETSSALSYALRTERVTASERDEAEAALNRFLDPQRPSTTIASDDFHTVRSLLARHATLRAPDALHLAVAVREGWSLATLDHRLAAAATLENVPLAIS